MHEVVTEERLDELAERFHRHGILKRFGIPFGKYILYPDSFDRMADRHERGAVICDALMIDGIDCPVATTN